MPIVIITRDPYRVTNKIVKNLVEVLPGVVAKNLTVPDTDCEITESDVGIKVRDHGPLDRHTRDLEITIWAGRHKERLKNLEQRRIRIRDEVRRVLSGEWPRFSRPPGFVWLLLADDSFGDI